MSQDGITKIKTKLQELADLIKEESVGGTQELKEEILENVNEMKAKVEENLQGAEKFKDKIEDKIEDNVDEFLKDMEWKALKIQYTLQEKYSQGIAQKDEIVDKATASLIETINKVKNTLHSKN